LRKSKNNSKLRAIAHLEEQFKQSQQGKNFKRLQVNLRLGDTNPKGIK